MNTPLVPEATAESNPCFADSRRLTGHNRFFAGCGVVLETRGPTAQDPAAHERWQSAALALRRALGWRESPLIVRPHANGTLLAFAAPIEALFTATEVNEWAWEQASGLFAPGFNSAVDPPFDQLHSLGSDFPAVVARFKARETAERNPALLALRDAARERGLPVFVDDHEVSIGAGAGSQTWPLTSLPEAVSVAWAHLYDVPTALVTGSNGKTTTVRLLSVLIAARNAQHPGQVGYSSTEGVVIGNAHVGEGDYAGPAGARLVLRDRRVEAAVLETARGGILRRGLAVEKADVAIVTNISGDHFGEYGIDSLDDLADVKMTVAHALRTNGTIVLNADDPVLLTRAGAQICHVALFASDDAHPALVALRLAGGSTCGAVDGHLWLTYAGTRADLGNIRDMPLSVNGAAVYNVANISAAALAAAALDVPARVLVAELQRFGSRRDDNPGRMERWLLNDLTVLIDYAHNPHGIAGLLSGSQAIQLDQVAKGGMAGRVGLLLGQAGNRNNVAIAELARTVAKFRPDFVIIKEISTMLRGRASGEVPALLKNSLLTAGYPTENIHFEADEVEAARQLLRWAQRGDVLVLPVHQSAARSTLTNLLDTLEGLLWQPGSTLPPVISATEVHATS